MLVIIGLIVGGVLVGNDLIEAAKMRQQISQIQELQTSINTFRVKYNAMPGDMRNATAMGLGSNSALHDGNGDRQLGNSCFSNLHHATYDYSKENYNFFKHLGDAGLVDKTYGGYTVIAHGTWWTLNEIYPRFPRGKLKNASIVIPSTGCGTVHIGNALALGMIDESFPQYFDKATVMTGETATSIDRKVDDGALDSGNVRMFSSSGDWQMTAMPTNPSASCGTPVGSTLPNCTYVRGMIWMNQF